MKNHYEWFMDKCKVFDDNMRFSSYVENVCKCLIYLDYNCSVLDAIKDTYTSIDYIKEFYLRKESIYNCSIELGYSCG